MEHNGMHILDVRLSDWDHIYAKDLLAEIVDELEPVGFNDVNIFYDISCNQGSGACFTAKSLDVKDLYEHFKDELKFDFEFAPTDILKDDPLADFLGINDVPHMVEEMIKHGYFSGYIQKTDHRYEHENTVTLELEADIYSITEHNKYVNYAIFEITQEMADELDRFETYFTEFLSGWIKTKCRSIHKLLSKDYEEFAIEVQNELDNEEVTP